MDFKGTGGYFEVKTANEWIEESMLKPIPKMLFSEFWYEGDVTIFFADTKQGKSILAVQVADSISKGIPIEGFSMEAQKQEVLYFDFELSGKQFEGRYSDNYKLHYKFDDNFKRIERSTNYLIPKGSKPEEIVRQEIEEVVKNSSAKVVIIDNMSALLSDSEKAKDAGSLMMELKQLKNKYGLSMLILAHTPKVYDNRPISINDLAGSKQFSNLCDGAFAIGKNSFDSSIKYIKQVAVRTGEEMYGEDNVIICQLEKKLNFLQFTFKGFGSEYDNIRISTDEDREDLKQRIQEFHKQGLSLRDIADKVGVSHSKVSRLLKDM